MEYGPQYTQEFLQLRDGGGVPRYQVFPVTAEPVVFARNPAEYRLAWQVAIAPAFDAPNDKFFLPISTQYQVEIKNLIGVRGDKALFFHLAVRGVTERIHERTAARMLSAIHAMKVLVNHTVQPEEAADQLYYQSGPGSMPFAG